MVAQDKVNVNLKNLFLAFGVMVVAVIYGVGLIANGDPLWFLPFFTEKPMKIVVSDKGCTVELYEGEKGFDDIYLAFNQSVTQQDGLNEQFGFGPGRVQEYRNTHRVVEFYYDHPVTIHTNYRFGRPDSVFVPLTGPFAESRAVFGGHEGNYWSGALRLKSIDSIARAASEIQCSN